MRTNKFIPFCLAVILHMFALLYFPAPKAVPARAVLASAQTLSSHEIDLTGFSLSPKIRSGQSKNVSNPIKTVGLPTPSTAETLGESEVGPDRTAAQEPAVIFSQFREPAYPPIARLNGYEGKVTIKAFYNREGFVTNVDIVKSSGIKMLDEAVKKAASDWKLKSAFAGSFEKTFEFKLNN